MSRSDSDPRGHYRVAGGALGFVGVVGLVLAAGVTFLRPQDLGFIDAPTMTLFSMLFIAVAAWMVAWNGSTPSS